MLKKNLKFNSSIIVLILITFFIFAISFTAFYTKENFSPVCGCKLPIWVIIISIASFGMFTGLLIYYLLHKEMIKEKKNVTKSIKKLLNFLENDERKVLEYILKNSGEIYQSKITKELKLDKVKTSRIISQLEKKEIITRKKEGMTNKIKIEKDLKNLL